MTLPTFGELANAAVINTFDTIDTILALFPANPFSDFVSGSLLLVRRNWLSQAPTADPYQFAIKASGQLVGTVGAVDPAGAALTYTLKKAPTYGSVTVGADGVWTYTPGPDFAYGQPESFIVTVGNGGYNIFMPTSRDVSVPIGAVNWTNTFRVANFTAHDIVLNEITPGYFARVTKSPPINYVVSPGEQFGVTFYHPSGDQKNTSARITLSDPGNPAATYIADADLPGSGYSKDRFKYCGGNQSSCRLPSNDRFTVLFGDAAGEMVLNPEDKNAKVWLNNLQQLVGPGTGGLTVNYVNPAVTPVNNLMSISGAYQFIENLSGAQVTRQITLGTTVTTTETKSWEVGAGVELGIKKILTVELQGKYGGSWSLANATTEETTTTVVAKPYSYVGVSAAAPMIEIAGDMRFKFADVGPTYLFKDVNYYVPDERANNGGFGAITTFQVPVGQGTWLVDDKATNIQAPVYAVGDPPRQLSFYGYTTGPLGGNADQWPPGTENLTYLKGLMWSSSNPAVATVDGTGRVTAVGAGTSTIRVQYNWSITTNRTPYQELAGEAIASVPVIVKSA